MKLFFVLFLLLLAQVVLGQKRIAATATINKTDIVIGEQTQLDLKIIFPPKNKPSFFRYDTIPHFEILQQTGVDTQRVNDTLILSQRLTITSWDSGTWQIPAFRLAGNRTVQTKPLSVTISFSPFDPKQEYHGIKDIIEVPKEKKSSWLWYVVISLLLVGLFILLFPRRKKQEAPAPVASINAYEKALKELEELEGDAPADDKVFYTRLIDIFRSYLQQRKGIHSFQKTTGDLSRQLQQLNMKEKIYRDMVESLQLSDFVKFARYVPAAEERKESLQIIKTTIQHIEPLQE